MDSTKRCNKPIAKWLILLVAAVLGAVTSIMVAVGGISTAVAAKEQGVHDFCVCLTAEGANASSNTIYPDKKRNFYLTNATDPTNLTVRFNESDQVTYGGAGSSKRRSVRTGECIDLSGCEIGDGVYEAEFFVNAGSVGKYTFRLPGRTVGAVHVRLNEGVDSLDRTKDSLPTQAIVTGADGRCEYSDNSTASMMRSRGNATWTYAKKAYQLELAEKTPILGMKSAKKWILIANYIDQSMIRNAIAYKMGECLGMKYTPDFEYADLYINGEYRGLYMVTEKVEIGKNRVDIYNLDKENKLANRPNEQFEQKRMGAGTPDVDETILSSVYYLAGVKNPKNITGGYLVEIDNQYYGSELCRFTTRDSLRYVVKSPSYASYAEMKYISRLFAEGEEAINSPDGYNSLGRHYSEYFDVKSLAQAYCVAEMLKNWDGFYSSTFFYKDIDEDGVTSKIFSGPLWDYDNSLGNINSGDFSYRTDDLWIAEPTDGRNKSLAENLMTRPEFCAEVAEVYEQMQPIIRNMLCDGGYIDTLVDGIYRSVMNDYIVWNKDNKKAWPKNYDGSHVGVGFFQFRNSYNDGEESAVGYVKLFLERRNRNLAPILGVCPINNAKYGRITVLGEAKMLAEPSCELVKIGSRASVRATDESVGKIIVLDSNGKECKLVRSNTGSKYEDGIWSFRMPLGGVSIGLRDDADSQTGTNPVEIETKSGETESEIGETESESGENRTETDKDGSDTAEIRTDAVTGENVTEQVTESGCKSTLPAEVCLIFVAVLSAAVLSVKVSGEGKKRHKTIETKTEEND